jgi:pectin methylesterase-like acyl-CoA thioesterase
MKFSMRPLFLTAMLLGLTSAGFSVALAENPASAPRTITVALDGSGDFSSIQEAVDSAGKGDTVFIKAGVYAQDLTIHSKEKLKIVSAGVDKTFLLGRGTMLVCCMWGSGRMGQRTLTSAGSRSTSTGDMLWESLMEPALRSINFM